MSRSGYVDDYEDQWGLIRYRGAVKSALKGRRGQSFLQEMIAALDALPDPKLAANSLQNEAGEFCALGAVGRSRNMAMAEIDPEDIEAVAAHFGISDAMAREIVYMNDEANWKAETPQQRWARMRHWAASWVQP